MFVAGYNGKIFRIETQQPTGTDRLTTNQLLSLSPNPALKEATLHLSQAIEPRAKARLYDAIGHLVASPPLLPRTPQEITVDLRGVPAGFYLLQLSTGASHLTRKLIVR